MLKPMQLLELIFLPITESLILPYTFSSRLTEISIPRVNLGDFKIDTISIVKSAT